jgi:hypothetical protein
MERRACSRKQFATAVEVERVVGVPTIGGATARVNDTGVTQPAQVVRDEALPLPREAAELPYAPVAAGEIAQQLPPQRVARQYEKVRWPDVDCQHAVRNYINSV